MLPKSFDNKQHSEDDADPGYGSKAQPVPFDDKSLKYTTLKSDSKQIRVLFVNNVSTDLEESWVSFTLKTVDLAARVSMAKESWHSQSWEYSEYARHITSHIEQYTGSPICGFPRPALGCDGGLEGRVKARIPSDRTTPRTRFHWGDYYAMSYVWGDSESIYSVIVNDCLFPVKQNLYFLLSELWV